MMTRSAAASLALLLLAAPSLANLEHSFLFPPNDEYDHKILDPNTIYGSPYGGFARATRSRLAQLPLVLPATEDGEYMAVTDSQGRRFACRAYSEDEVDKSSMTNSVFDRSVPRSQSHEDDNKDTAVVPATAEVKAPPTVENRRAAQHEIVVALQSLKGVCTQLHQGWWSYEWCFGEHVRQFHIELGEEINQIKMESITGLGSYRTRSIESSGQTVARRARQMAFKLLSVPTDDVHKDVVYQETLDRYMSPLLGKESELGQVIDRHENGAICESTKKPRTTKVEYRCCARDQLEKFKPFVIYDGNPVPSDIAAIVKLDEPSTCNYHIVVCTPLLCNGLAELYKSGPDPSLADGTVSTTNNINQHLLNKPPANLTPKKDNESIREIVDRTLEKVCLRQGNHNQWWIYELCHGQHVHQFHEGNVFDPETGLTSMQIETEYVLGIYDEEASESFVREDEIKYVVNVTEFDKAASVIMQAKRINRGNGAYFYQEYTDGQVCDGNDPDVKNKGGVPRSTTVRFYCGTTYELSNVNEDSTCHYVMDVTIPDLCEHPLVKKSADKKQVIKCLPIK